MAKYIIGEIFSFGGATLYKNHSDQTVTNQNQMFTKLIYLNNSHKWTFRLTEESLRSYHWLQNTKTDVFIEILPSSRRNLLEFTDHWILYDPIQNKYFKYDHLHVNAINEWNPMKLGDIY